MALEANREHWWEPRRDPPTRGNAGFCRTMEAPPPPPEPRAPAAEAQTVEIRAAGSKLAWCSVATCSPG